MADRALDQSAAEATKFLQMRRGRASDLTLCIALYRETRRVIQVIQTARAHVANAAARAFPLLWAVLDLQRAPACFTTTAFLPLPLRVLPVPAKFRTRRRGRRHPRRPRPGEDRQVTTVAGRVATEVKPEPFRARERGRDLFSRASSAQPLILGRSTSEWPPSGRACPAHPRASRSMACLYSRPSRKERTGTCPVGGLPRLFRNTTFEFDMILYY